MTSVTSEGHSIHQFPSIITNKNNTIHKFYIKIMKFPSYQYFDGGLCGIAHYILTFDIVFDFSTGKKIQSCNSMENRCQIQNFDWIIIFNTNIRLRELLIYS